MKNALIAVFLPCVIYAVAENPSDPWKAPEEEERLRQTIEQEIGSLNEHPWAGSYYMGDGLGTNIVLTVAPESGFTITWRGCLGLYGHNYGAVVEKEERLILEPKLPNKTDEFGAFDLEYIPVKWGQRHYLVAVDEIADFCNQVNSGLEPRKGTHGLSLLRDGDENYRVGGLPELPAQYRKFLLLKPIRAKILTVGPGVQQDEIVAGDRSINYEITIDAGEQDGVYKGLEFHVVDAVRATTIEITSIQSKTSTGNYLRWSEELFAEPKPAWNLSTRPRR